MSKNLKDQTIPGFQSLPEMDLLENTEDAEELVSTNQLKILSEVTYPAHGPLTMVHKWYRTIHLIRTVGIMLALERPLHMGNKVKGGVLRATLFAPLRLFPKI